MLSFFLFLVVAVVADMFVCLNDSQAVFVLVAVKHDFLSEQMATLYKIVHIVNFNTSIQALMLLHQVVDPR